MGIIRHVSGDGASTGPCVSAYFCCFLLYTMQGWGKVGRGVGGGNSAVRTASHAAVLPDKRSCLWCLPAMVEPSVCDELRQCRVSKVASSNIRPVKRSAATAQGFSHRCLTTCGKACGSRKQALISSSASLDSLQKLRERKRRVRRRLSKPWKNAQNQTSEGYLTVFLLPEITTLFVQMGGFP